MLLWRRQGEDGNMFRMDEGRKRVIGIMAAIGQEERADKLNTDDPRAAKATTSTKPCVACKQPIPSGSSLCSACKSYQHSWKNQLQYVAGIATLLALTVSALFWVIEKTRSTFFSREDVVLVACNTLDTIMIEVLTEEMHGSDRDSDLN